MGSRALKKVASIALPVIGAAVGGPAGAAIGGGVSGAISGKGLKGIGIGALTGYAGNVIGSSLGSSLSGIPGGSSSIGSLTSKNAFGPYSFGDFGSSTANALGATAANTTIGNAIGQYAGNSLAGSAADSLFPQTEEAQSPQATPFSPSRQAQLEAPSSLSGFSPSLTPDQTSTNLATQGVYGGGLGPEEEGYFTNMINRKLVDDAGNVDSDFNDVTPIEQSYLSQLGLGSYGNPKDLLEALSKWKAA